MLTCSHIIHDGESFDCFFKVFIRRIAMSKLRTRKRWIAFGGWVILSVSVILVTFLLLRIFITSSTGKGNPVLDAITSIVTFGVLLPFAQWIVIRQYFPNSTAWLLVSLIGLLIVYAIDIVITTLGIVEEVFNNIDNEENFIKLCRKRTVFSNDELKRHWNYSRYNKPFIVKFLYTYSFPTRINLKRLIELGIIRDVDSAPRGFEEISDKSFNKIIEETNTYEPLLI